MDNKVTFVEGGVRIMHQCLGGKHQYEVDVVKFNTSNGGNAFARKGDRLTLINNIPLENLTPEEFAQLLNDGNSKLTMHHACSAKEPNEDTQPEESILRPFKKDTTPLCFTLEMRREVDLENETGASGSCQMGSEKETSGGDMLVVNLTNTSIAVVRSRGCEVSRGRGTFKEDHQTDNIAIESIAYNKYLRGLCMEKSPFLSPDPELMTIYYYKSDVFEEPYRGMPVVLNFTHSNCFLKCSKGEDQVRLHVEAFDKQQLKQISRTDESTLAFLFYMKATRTGQRHFESALCTGWFIHLVNQDTVQMDTEPAPQEDPSFLFVIQK